MNNNNHQDEPNRLETPTLNITQEPVNAQFLNAYNNRIEAFQLAVESARAAAADATETEKIAKDAAKYLNEFKEEVEKYLIESARQVAFLSMKEPSSTNKAALELARSKMIEEMQELETELQEYSYFLEIAKVNANNAADDSDVANSIVNSEEFSEFDAVVPEVVADNNDVFNELTKRLRLMVESGCKPTDSKHSFNNDKDPDDRDDNLMNRELVSSPRPMMSS